jgi:hypothetical protein
LTSGHDQTPQLHVQGRRNGAEQSGALPALVYKSALDVTRDAAAALEKIFKDNGWGRDQWRDGIYPFVHYHAMLGIARGCSRVQLGGHQGETLEFADVAVLPADTGHGFSAARTSWSSAPIRRRVPIISATATIRPSATRLWARFQRCRRRRAIQCSARTARYQCFGMAHEAARA